MPGIPPAIQPAIQPGLTPSSEPLPALLPPAHHRHADELMSFHKWMPGGQDPAQALLNADKLSCSWGLHTALWRLLHPLTYNNKEQRAVFAANADYVCIAAAALSLPNSGALRVLGLLGGRSEDSAASQARCTARLTAGRGHCPRRAAPACAARRPPPPHAAGPSPLRAVNRPQTRL